MKQLKNLLMSCGATLLVINAVIFVSLHSSLKYRGIVQITLMLIGAIMFLLGTFLPSRSPAWLCEHGIALTGWCEECQSQRRIS